ISSESGHLATSARSKMRISGGTCRGISAISGSSFDAPPGVAPTISHKRHMREGTMAAPIVYGPNFSTYVRTTRLALFEKPVTHELSEVAFMQGAHKQEPFLKRNPFGRVPAFEHDGFTLYETAAITRYIDRAFPGAKLQPSDPRQLARMDQVIG